MCCMQHTVVLVLHAGSGASPDQAVPEPDHRTILAEYHIKCPPQAYPHAACRVHTVHGLDPVLHVAQEVQGMGCMRYPPRLALLTGSSAVQSRLPKGPAARLRWRHHMQSEPQLILCVVCSARSSLYTMGSSLCWLCMLHAQKDLGLVHAACRLDQGCRTSVSHPAHGART